MLRAWEGRPSAVVRVWVCNCHASRQSMLQKLPSPKHIMWRASGLLRSQHLSGVLASSDRLVLKSCGGVRTDKMIESAPAWTLSKISCNVYPLCEVVRKGKFAKKGQPPPCFHKMFSLK